MHAELEPIFDSRKSFYGKAKVEITDTAVTLYSYAVKVAEIDRETWELKLFPQWKHSATTLRHVKEFLRQNGIKAETKTQIARDYEEVTP